MTDNVAALVAETRGRLRASCWVPDWIVASLCDAVERLEIERNAAMGSCRIVEHDLDAARRVARELAARCQQCGGTGMQASIGMACDAAPPGPEKIPCERCGKIRAANPWLVDVA